MKTYLIFDTETTGFPINAPARDEKQGRVCQLAMLLCDEQGNHLSEMSFYIKPDGWKIQQGAQNVHGITDEICEKYGISSNIAFDIFSYFIEIVDCVICHNTDFDFKMMRIESQAHNKAFPYIKEIFCTMKATTDICKLEGKYGNYKYPKLSEALKEICKKELGDEAHDALVDAKACKDIFFTLLNNQNIKKAS